MKKIFIIIILILFVNPIKFKSANTNWSKHEKTKLCFKYIPKKAKGIRVVGKGWVMYVYEKKYWLRFAFYWFNKKEEHTMALEIDTDEYSNYQTNWRY